MSTIAIIAEYNPFHNGHLYLLNKAKEITNCDNCISIMSGNFLQRGEIAMWNKYKRAKMATLAGIDAVIELPFCYSTGSAGDFAMGAISILDKLNSIDYLCFGAENDNIELFNKIAEICINEPADYKKLLKAYTSDGLAFPLARTKALCEYTGSKEIEYTIDKPNNILALEYIISLKRLNSSIKPVIVKRIGSNYHDQTINTAYSSATSIRNMLCNNHECIEKELNEVLPSSTLSEIMSKKDDYKLITSNALYDYIKYSLLNCITVNSKGKNTFCCKDIADVNEDIANKLAKLDLINLSTEQIIEELTSKQYTRSRITRALLHIQSNYRQSTRKLFIDNNYAFYANILAIKQESSALIKHIKSLSSIPLITKKSDFNSYFKDYDSINYEAALKMWELDIRATNTYNSIDFEINGKITQNDFNTVLPIV